MSYGNKIKWFALILLLAMLLCSLSTQVRADTRPVLCVAHNPLPPWKTTEKDGTPGGIDTELLRLLAARMGFDLKFKFGPFARCLFMLENGQADIMATVLRSPERELSLYYLQPPVHTHSNKAFYVRKNSRISINRFEDLYHLRIGTNIGVNYFSRFDSDPKLIRDPAPKNFRINIRKLLNTRVDVIVGTEAMVDYYIGTYGLGDRIEKCSYVYNKPNNAYFVLSKKSVYADRLEEFNDTLRTLMKEKALDRIGKALLQRTDAHSPARSDGSTNQRRWTKVFVF